MLSSIIQYLNAKLQLTNYFEKQFEIAQLITKDDITAPLVYCENGQWKNVLDIDYTNGLSYWRETSPRTQSENTELSTVACKTFDNITYSLRLVGFVPKEKTTVDDAYTTNRITTSLAKQLTDNNSDLKTTLKAFKVEITSNSVNEISSSVLSSENPSGQLPEIDPKFSVFSIDFTLTIIIRNDCIDAECDFDSDILHSFDFCNPLVIERLTPTQRTCLISELCAPINELSCEELNDSTLGLTNNQRQLIQHIYPLKTGRTLSVQTGDDGDLQNGRLVDFLTLNCNNSFGNTNRYTDDVGTQIYANDYVIDHVTGLGWYRVQQAATNWANAISIVNSGVSFAGFNDWYFPNIRELFSIYNCQEGQIGLNYVGNPWNSPGFFELWSSTLTSNPTISMNLRNTFPVTQSLITNTRNYIVVRKHF